MSLLLSKEDPLQFGGTALLPVPAGPDLIVAAYASLFAKNE